MFKVIFLWSSIYAYATLFSAFMVNLDRVQQAVCISQMVKHDYPGRWPGIAEKVAMFLQSDQHVTWMGALICLYQLVKNFE